MQELPLVKATGGGAAGGAAQKRPLPLGGHEALHSAALSQCTHKLRLLRKGGPAPRALQGEQAAELAHPATAQASDVARGSRLDCDRDTMCGTEATEQSRRAPDPAAARPPRRHRRPNGRL